MKASVPGVDKALAEAVEWAIKVEFNHPEEATRLAFEHWLASDGAHATAWARVSGVQASFKKLPGDLAISVLNTAGQSREAAKIRKRSLLKLMLLVGAGAPAAWLVREQAPWERLLADESTSFGQVRTLHLADGTVIKLNSDSAINIDLDDRNRTITLRRGEMSVVTGSDAQSVANGNPKRPFWVKTPYGTVQAIGTRFAVRLDDSRARIGLREGAIELTPRRSNSSVSVKPGQSWWLYDGRAELAEETGIGSTDWEDGLIIADKARLDTLVAELARYRRGVITCDDAVAGMTISGFYHIEDTDMTLRFLSTTHPLEIRYLTRYWVRIAAKTEKKA